HVRQISEKTGFSIKESKRMVGFSSAPLQDLKIEEKEGKVFYKTNVFYGLAVYQILAWSPLGMQKLNQKDIRLKIQRN
ncbi:MAG: hypothetical protein JW812_03740, partial [Alphaproteobacteria bacterium]|nr:hypothetical protein [Alphaproteobacteria bacterium]